MVHDERSSNLLIAGRALSNGGRMNSLISTEWDFAGSCENPYKRSIRGAPAAGRDGTIAVVRGVSKSPFYVDLSARCRKCGPCLRHRGYVWQQRCATELAMTQFMGYRAWFVTFTFKPAFHLWALGSIGNDKRGFPQVARIANRCVTLWLKRLRKQGSAFRYCVVMEPHLSGVPHLHGIFHEIDPGQRLTERKLRGSWSENGFLRANLINLEEGVGRSSAYLSKYLTKVMLARVRASKQYGRPVAPVPTGDVLLETPVFNSPIDNNIARVLNSCNPVEVLSHAP